MNINYHYIQKDSLLFNPPRDVGNMQRALCEIHTHAHTQRVYTHTFMKSMAFQRDFQEYGETKGKIAVRSDLFMQRTINSFLSTQREIFTLKLSKLTPIS